MLKSLLLRLSWWIDLWYNKKGLWPNSWGWIRIFFPYSSLFYVASIQHDIWYSNWYLKKDKIRVDNMFFLMMLIVSKNYIQRFFARFYFYMVKFFWFLYFNYKN